MAQSTVTSSGAVTESVNSAYKTASSQIGSIMLTSSGKMTIFFGGKLYYEGMVDDLVIAGAATAQQKYDYFKGRLSMDNSTLGSIAQTQPDSASTRFSIRVVNFPDSTKYRKVFSVSNFPDSTKYRYHIGAKQIGMWTVNTDSLLSRKQVEILNLRSDKRLDSLVQLGIVTNSNLDLIVGQMATSDNQTVLIGQLEAHTTQNDTTNNRLLQLISKPVGNASANNQVVGNMSLSNIDAKIPSIGQKLMATSLPVTIASNQTALPVTGTFWQSTQPISGAISVSNFPDSTKYRKLVQVSNFPAIQPVSGIFWPTTQPVSASALPLPSGAATEATLAAINTKTPALGQALAAGSVPMVLPASQITALTPFSNVGYALDASVNTLLKPASTLAGVTTVSAVTAITNALPAGTNTIGNVNQTLATAGFGKITDGTNIVTVKAGNTIPALIDPALVVSLSGNSANMGTIAASSVPTRMGVVGGIYNTALPTLTTGQMVANQLDINGRLLTNEIIKSANVSATATITTGGTAQVAIAANTARLGFQIQNISTADLYFTIGGTAALNVGFKLALGATYSNPATLVATAAISIWGATTGQQFTTIQY